MISLFILAHEFPPLNSGGSQRPLKFVKYLPEFGINSVVFSIDPASYPVVFKEYSVDEAMMAEIPDQVEVIRVQSDDIISLKKRKLRYFLATSLSVIQREGQGWRRHLIPRFDKEVRRRRPQVLMVTVPPFSMAPLGVELSERFNLPLILDMRDAWSGWYASPYRSYLHYLLTLRLERRCFDAAREVIATSDQTVAEFRRLHPTIPAERFHVITNGYDREIDNWKAYRPRRADNEFVIGYVGSFYYDPASRRQMFTPWWRKRGHRMLQYVPHREDWLYRSPWFFFRAVRTLLNRTPESTRRLHIRFAGSKPGWIDGMVQEFNLGGIVEFLGQLPLSESLRFQESCDALLLTSSKVIGGQDYSIAGKTFEYISMKKPIIGFVTEGAQKQLLEQSGLALICDPDRPDEASARLERLLTGDWRAAPSVEFLQSLHSRNLTGRLAGIIEKVVNGER
jgi:hypothetical protein